MNSKIKNEISRKTGKFLLWLGFLLPPAAWLIQLEAVYLTSERGCKTADFMPNHLVSIFAILLSIIGGVLSWRNWLEAGKGWRSVEASPLSILRFMGILGMLMGALFTLVIFAQWLPTLLGVPCDK